MTDQHSFAYIETGIAVGLTIREYRRSRPTRGRTSIRTHWMRVTAGIRRGKCSGFPRRVEALTYADA